MHIVIVGGGKVGYSFAKMVLAKNEKVVIIESNAELCRKISDELDIAVINGDGTDANVLLNAGIQKAKAIVAVTEKDGDNLVACQIAKMNFKVKHTIARINDPQNFEFFQKLGVDNPMCFATQIANLF